MIRSAAHVLANEPLSPTVRRLLIAIDDPRFDHRPGQAVIVEVPAGTSDAAATRAPYSVASGPREHGRGTVELAIASDEPGSAADVLHSVAPGAGVLVEGPVGNFVREGHALDAPGLFIAAGTGLSPLRSMLADELGRRPQEGPPLVLLYGVRSEADILWQSDLLHAWPKASQRVSVLVTLSRGSAEWTGRRGWVQDHLRDAVDLAGSSAFAFVCGPERMVSDVMTVLNEKHLPEARVLRERYV